MTQNPWNKRVSPASLDDDGDDDGGRKTAMIIPMGATALSGFLTGLLARGEFAAAGILFVTVVFCCFAGWWTRGVVR